MGIMLSNWFADIFFGRIAIIIYVIILFLLILVFLYTVFLKDQLKEKTIIFDNEYNNLNNRVGIDGAGGSGNNGGPNNSSRAKLTGRFFELTAIDNKLKEYQKITEDKTYTLRDICEDFRNFAANDSGGLYYDISEIRHFIAGLGVTHQLSFQFNQCGKKEAIYSDILTNLPRNLTKQLYLKFYMKPIIVTRFI